MSERRRYRCLSCGHRFEADVLTSEEKREAQRQDRRLYPLGCPDCQRTDVRLGWD